MKKCIQLCVMSIMLTFGLHAQCTFTASVLSEVYKKDTTFEIVTVDTLGSGYSLYPASSYTFTWSYGGNTYTGLSVKLPVTETGINFDYSVSVTGLGCSSGSYLGSVSANSIFKCSELSANWDQTTMNVPLLNAPAYPHIENVGIPFVCNDLSSNSLSANNVKINLQLDWGNGRSAAISQYVIGSNAGFYVGDSGGTANSSNYIHSGQYDLNASYYFSLDTQTCPVGTLPNAILHLGGSIVDNLPLLSGARSYCTGDTIKLDLVDTSVQFHNNVLRKVNPAGHTADFFLSNNIPLVYGEDRAFQWFKGDLVNTWNYIGTDTLLRVNSLTLADSGTYGLVMYDYLTQTDTFMFFHIDIHSTAPIVPAITGVPIVCQGATTILSNAVVGGIWSSSSPSVSISDGVVSGISVGNAIVSYSLSNSCGMTTDTMSVTVISAPQEAVISGQNTVRR